MTAAEAGAAAGWDAALRPLLDAEKLLVALDFDGTLAPLGPDPAASRPLPAASAAVERLAALDWVALALVSGRPAADLVELAGPPNGVNLVGSHGAELGYAGAGGAVLRPTALSDARRSRLAAAREALEALAATAAGAWVELKPFAAVLHTRPMTDRPAAAELERRAAQLGAELGVHVLAGKRVVELAVAPVGKAGALGRLKSAARADRMVFIGDDVTDELALKTIKPPDLGVKVGGGATAAALRLADPAAVARFLTYLAAACEHRQPRGAPTGRRRSPDTSR
ncbi:MAG: trehalose-phosphatase [Bifidobacteriaceae bacterium]|nr:trehalose-phosphatase [Bifidobacteriaceae bacterium]